VSLRRWRGGAAAPAQCGIVDAEDGVVRGDRVEKKAATGASWGIGK
jgi:hypothetical protein